MEHSKLQKKPRAAALESRGPSRRARARLLLVLTATVLIIASTGCQTTHHIGTLQSTLAAGRVHKLPYIIQSATILVDIEDSPREKPTQRRTAYRYVYTLRPLKNIQLTDNTFSEFLDNKVGKRMEYWHGPDLQCIEVFKPDAKGFQVKFAAPEGETRTVVTGMTIYEDLPLKDHRQIRSFDFSPNEFSVFYPNKEDYIAELTMVVTSSTTALKVKEESAWRMADDHAKPAFSPAASFPPDAPKWNGTTLSARFEKLKPGETVGLEYSW